MTVLDEVADVSRVDSQPVAWDYPQARWTEEFADAVQEMLSDRTRRATSEIKQAMLGGPGVREIDIDRAAREEKAWHARSPEGGLRKRRL